MEAAYVEVYQTLLREHEEVFKKQDLKQMRALMDAIKQCRGSIFVTGMGREGIACRSFAMRLTHLGKKVFWLWDDTTPGMHEGDLFICANGSGCIGLISYVYQQAKKTGVTIAVITGDPNQAAKDADLSLFIPATVYRGSYPDVVPTQQPMGNLFEQHLFLLFDIIVMLLEKELEISHDEMESRHRNVE